MERVWVVHLLIWSSLFLQWYEPSLIMFDVRFNRYEFSGYDACDLFSPVFKGFTWTVACWGAEEIWWGETPSEGRECKIVSRVLILHILQLPLASANNGYLVHKWRRSDLHRNCFVVFALSYVYTVMSTCSYRLCELLYEKKRQFAKVLSCYLRDPNRRVSGVAVVLINVCIYDVWDNNDTPIGVEGDIYIAYLPWMHGR